jgi:RNA polymerase primary sigma factor
MYDDVVISEVEESLSKEEIADALRINLDDPISAYKRNAAKFDFLTHKEEIELSHRVLAGDIAARNELVTRNLRLVFVVAKKYTWSTLPLEDLVQEGNEGLMVAASRFDHTRGTRFSTVAMWWIRARITEAIMNISHTIRVPSKMQDLHREMEKIVRAEISRTGKSPSSESLAKQTGATLERVRDVQRTIPLRTTVSLQMPLERGGDADGASLLDIVADSALTPELLHEARDALHEARAELQEIVGSIRAATEEDLNYEIVLRRMGLYGNSEPETSKSIAVHFGLHPARAQQISRRLLCKVGVTEDKIMELRHRIAELEKILA